MPDPYYAIGSVAASLLSSSEQADAASEAAAAQSASSAAGIEEQRRQFNEIQKLLAPYVQAGRGAIGGFQPFQQGGQQAYEQQLALLGFAPKEERITAHETPEGMSGVSFPVTRVIRSIVGGEAGQAAQQAAIDRIAQSPLLQAQMRQGEEAILQRASATGGLRGGNVQAALAQFRPQMLQQAIEQQYARLGGMAGAGLGATEQLYRGGQASAAGQASLAQTTGANVGNLLAQQGAAQAGGALGRGAAFGQFAQIPGMLGGYQLQTGKDIFGSLFGGSGGGYAGGLPSGLIPAGVPM